MNRRGFFGLLAAAFGSTFLGNTARVLRLRDAGFKANPISPALMKKDWDYVKHVANMRYIAPVVTFDGEDRSSIYFVAWDKDGGPYEIRTKLPPLTWRSLEPGEIPELQPNELLHSLPWRTLE